MQRFRAYVATTEFDDPHLAIVTIDGVQMVCVGSGGSTESAIAEAHHVCEVPSLIVWDDETMRVIHPAQK